MATKNGLSSALRTTPTRTSAAPRASAPTWAGPAPTAAPARSAAEAPAGAIGQIFTQGPLARLRVTLAQRRRAGAGRTSFAGVREGAECPGSPTGQDVRPQQV